MAISNAGYELNAVTTSDEQVEFARDLDGITHTINEITHQNLLRSRLIGIQYEEVYFLPPPKYPRIGEKNQPALYIVTWIVQAPQMLKLPAVQ